jgi:hypothetical protein
MKTWVKTGMLFGAMVLVSPQVALAQNAPADEAAGS